MRAEVFRDRFFEAGGVPARAFWDGETLQGEAGRAVDFAERVRAFGEKRPPVFGG
jgi:hypothetical protein